MTMRLLVTAESTRRPTPSAPPKTFCPKSPFWMYSWALAMTSNWSSSFCTWRLACSSSSQSGALRVISAIWSLITGATATTNSASTAMTATSTSSTDRPRRIPRRMKNSTTGLSPIARNIDMTSRISTEEMLSSCSVRKIAATAPSAPKKPILNGEWRSSSGVGAGSAGT